MSEIMDITKLKSGATVFALRVGGYTREYEITELEVASVGKKQIKVIESSRFSGDRSLTVRQDDKGDWSIKYLGVLFPTRESAMREALDKLLTKRVTLTDMKNKNAEAITEVEIWLAKNE